MASIRHDIISSVMVHSVLLAAALLIGGSSEVRKTGFLTVSFFDQNDNSQGEQLRALVKQKDRMLIGPKTSKKTDPALSVSREILSIQDSIPPTPAKAQSDAESGFGAGVTDIAGQSNSSHNVGSRSSAVGSQALTDSSGEADSGSVSRWQKGQAAPSGIDTSLKQKIREALQANLVYPYIARKRRIEGTVLMGFRINSRGMPEGVRIVKGSSYSILDEAARETVLKTSPFPTGNNIIEVPIRFSLRGD